MPIHGRPFREAVAKAARPYLRTDLRQVTDNCTFQHPLGKRDSTLLYIGPDVLDRHFFVAFKLNGRTRVETLRIPSDYAQDDSTSSIGPNDVCLAAWSGTRLCAFMRFRGGTGNSDFARVFQLQRNKWSLVNTLQSRGENAWEGTRNGYRRLAPGSEAVRYSLIVRLPPLGQEDRVYHSAIWFDYREDWTFSH